MVQTGDKKPRIIVIVGPTASGKTDLAINLARKLNSEIVSADSRQIYRGMDIGTAKWRPNTKRIKTNGNLILDKNSISFGNHSGEVRHRLVDIKNPNEDYTVADYKKDALAAIRKILRAGKLPILVGGTGLYVRAVVDNLDIPKVKADPDLRKKLEEKMNRRGLAAIFEELVRLDPEAAYIVDPKNPRRVIRALEITLATKKPFSAQRKKGAPLFDPLIIGVNVAGEKLKKRINARVDEMLENGLVAEVKNLVKKYGPNQRALRRGSVQAFDAIGYREIIDHLKTRTGAEQTRNNAKRNQRGSGSSRHKSVSLPKEVVDLIKTNTWGYAKRQMTWFKKDKRVEWVKSERTAEVLVKKFLAN